MESKTALTNEKVYEMLEEIRAHVYNNYDPVMRKKVEEKAIEIAHIAWTWSQGG